MISENTKIRVFTYCMVIMAILLAMTTKPSHAQDAPQDYLNGHNTARASVRAGLRPLVWDNTLADYARRYAESRRGDCRLVHSGGPYGENLAWNSGNMWGRDAVKMWVDERVDYNYNSNTCRTGKACGHYTQVVWRNTLRVGCAKVRCNNGGTFIGCNYDPPGNIRGQWPY